MFFNKWLLLIFAGLFLFGFANASADLNAGNIDFNDVGFFQNDDINLNFFYWNDGDAFTDHNYNILLYVNDVLDQNIERSDFLNVGDFNYQNFYGSVSEVGDVNFYLCADYNDNVNLTDDCNSRILHVNYRDVNAGSIVVSDNSVNYGDSNLDINVQIGNSGNYDSNLVDAVLYVMQATNTSNYFTVSWTDFNVSANSIVTKNFTWSDVNLPGDVDFNLIVSPSETDSNTQNDFNYSANLMHVASADLNVGQIDFNDSDASINYGDSLLITATYGNSGDATATADYNLLYKINSTTVANYLFSTILNAGSTDTNAYTWTSNVGGDVNVSVCIDNSVSGGDSSENDCNSKTLHVKAVDLNAISISLNDSNVSGGASVTATLSYKNIGDLIADANYTITFKQYGSAITGCTFTITDDLAINGTTTKVCTFTASSPTSNTNYTIKGIVSYTGDKNSSNNETSTTLTVTGSGSGSGNAGGGGGSDSSDEDVDSDIDLKGISLTYLSESQINKEVSFDFVFKNIGVAKATDSYTASVKISKKGDEVKKCSQTFTDDLEVNATKTFTCKWTPKSTETGFFSLVAKIDYSSADDDSSNDTVEDKIIKIIDPNAVTSADLNATTTDTNNKGIVVLGENKLQQTISNSNILFNDLNTIFSAWGKEPPKDLNENLYSNITITRDFNNIVDANDVNKKSTIVTVKLFNSGDANIVNSIYYEIIPDFFGDKNVLMKFDINALDINKEFILSYSLQTEVDANKQKDFFGFMLKKDVLADFSLKDIAKKPFWKEIWFLIVLIVVGIIIIIAIIMKIIGMAKGSSGGFFKPKSSLARWGE